MFEYTTDSGLTPKIYTLSQLLVWRFHKTPELVNWPKELKLANQILKKFPSQEFWTKHTLPYKLNSLAFFLSGRGKNELFLSYNRFLLDNQTKTQYDLGEKVGEDKKFDKKKNLREFLT